MLNIVAGLAVVVFMLFLLSCLKAASDADDHMERLDDSRDDA